MKRVRSSVVAVLVTVLLFSTLTGVTVNASSMFWDLSETHWSYPYVEYMVNQGIVSGYPDGSFQPEEPFSRAAFAKLLCLAFDLPLYTGYDQIYQDVYTYDWHYPYIMGADEFLTYYDYGGGMYYFFPDDDAEREDVAVAMVKAMGLDPSYADLSYLDAYYDSGDVSYNLREYVALAIEYGVMQGSGGYFNPRASLTRAEGCTLFARFLTDIKGTYVGSSSSYDPGWYMIDNGLVLSDYDFDTYGFVESSTYTGEALYDSYYIEEETGGYVVTHSRSTEGGSYYTGSSYVYVDVAPEYIAEGDYVTMYLSNFDESVDTWGCATNTNISFSSVFDIGYGAAGDFSFSDASGDAYFHNQGDYVTSDYAFPSGTDGSIRYIKISIGHGYGYVYAYQWFE